MKEIKHPFEYQAPTPEDVQNITAFREKCKDMYDLLIERLPNSKCRAMAITSMEEFSHWVNKAIVFGDAAYPHEAPYSIAGLTLEGVPHPGVTNDAAQ